MRASLTAVIPVLLVLAACDQGPSVPREKVVGVWSFDRTCASGDGMNLRADGTMWLNECCKGTWTLDGNTISMRIRDTGQVGDTDGKPGNWETVKARIEAVTDKDLTLVWLKDNKRVKAKLCRRK